jgi:hypothetical protein
VVVGHHGELTVVYAQHSQCSMDMEPVLFSLRRHHFVCIFNLRTISREFYFSVRTTIYNHNLFHSVIHSTFSDCVSLRDVHRYCSAIVTAVIVNPVCTVIRTHSLCKSVLDDNKQCLFCGIRATHDDDEEILLTFDLDDGSGTLIRAVSFGSKLPNFSLSPRSFTFASPKEIKTYLHYIICFEFKFFLSLSSFKEFNLRGTGNLWRVDMCTSSVHGIDDEVSKLLEQMSE